MTISEIIVALEKEQKKKDPNVKNVCKLTHQLAEYVDGLAAQIDSHISYGDHRSKT